MKKQDVEELRPHFIFNAMNAIRFLIRNDPDAAYARLYDLARYMRENLDKAVSEGDITLEEELTYANSYLQLEQMMRKKLSVKWDVQDGSGTVPRGCISEAVSELLKADIEANRQERTLTVQRSVNEKQITIFIVETGEKVTLFVRE